jgi:MFS family permease
VLGHLRASRVFFATLIGAFCLVTLSSYAGTSWNPAFLGRVHHLEPRQVGLSLGGLVLVFGVSGVLTAGWISNRLQARGARSAPIWVAMAGAVLGWLPGIAAPLVDNLPTALALLGVREFFMVFPYPLAAAAIQMATPGRMRGQITAVYMFAINLIGLGLGPTVTALLSDYVFTDPMGVRFSLAWVHGAVAPLAILLLVLAARTFPAAVARAEAAP